MTAGASADQSDAMLLQARPSDTSAAAHDRVYRTLRARIMHGEIAPGAALTLRGIGREFGVSMTPAREAVRRLVAEGALTLSSSGRVATPELSNERIEELAALRALIETELASRALPRAHMALIDRLTTINAAIAEATVKGGAVGRGVLEHASGLHRRQSGKTGGWFSGKSNLRGRNASLGSCRGPSMHRRRVEKVGSLWRGSIRQAPCAGLAASGEAASGRCWRECRPE